MENSAKRAQLLAAIAVIRESLQLDGGDLDVLGFEGTTARIRLLISKDACHECIMPKDLLEEMILMGIRESIPEVDKVELEDPRCE